MKMIAAIFYILLLHLLNNEVVAQSLGDYCFRIYEGAISKIRIQNNNKFEYHTLFTEHGYEEIIQKGFYQIDNRAIKFTFVEDQFLKTDSLVGYLSKNEIRIGEKESFLPYRKCKCGTYRRELKKWSKLRKRTK